ncbi:MAG: ketoacyl-ACP synthase III [Pseudomonadota bacterium]
MPLRAVGSAVPSVRHDAADIAAATGAEEAFIRDKVGVGTRYVLGPGETGVGLSAAACEALFAKSGLTAEAVDLIVFVTQTPDRRIPHNAPALAAAIGAREGCASFDVSLGCSGFVYGLSVVEAMIAAQGFENALLVTCDPYSRIMAAEDKATNAVFGDAAAACWIAADGPGARLSALDFGTDGAKGDAIRIDAGGAARPLVDLSRAEGADEPGRDALRLHMAGRDVFNFVNLKIPGSIAATLEKAGLKAGDVDAYALHQGSAYMLQALAKRAGLPSEKVAMNIGRYGNTVSSTIPLLLEEMIDAGPMAGRRVVISGFGVGLSWATGLLTFDEEFRSEGPKE